MERVQKNVVSPTAKPGRKNTAKRWEENTKKSRSKGKNNDGRSGGKAKEGSKVTFSDVECFFMKRMKGANEEDWNFLANFET